MRKRKKVARAFSRFYSYIEEKAKEEGKIPLSKQRVLDALVASKIK